MRHTGSMAHTERMSLRPIRTAPLSAVHCCLLLPGFPQDSSWVLHGPENDRTLGMRNWLAYNMARRMGRYASRTRYFELLLNTVSWWWQRQ